MPTGTHTWLCAGVLDPTRYPGVIKVFVSRCTDPGPQPRVNNMICVFNLHQYSFCRCIACYSSVPAIHRACNISGEPLNTFLSGLLVRFYTEFMQNLNVNTQFWVFSHVWRHVLQSDIFVDSVLFNFSNSVGY